MPPGHLFPTLHSFSRLLHVPGHSSLFDVKFYPYATEDDDAIFAVVASRDVIICRPLLQKQYPFEILRWFKSEDEENDQMHCLEWAQDPVTEAPLVCVSGTFPHQIRVLNAETGKAEKSLIGHGKAINDLAISPLSPSIMASASEDFTIRLWSLHPKHEKQRCRAILSGEGHRQPILVARFHPNGRWLLTGAHDNAVCVWAIPSLEELEETAQPILVHYPFFYSTEVHHNYVDSMAFYGDLILSRAAKDSNLKNQSNDIILWRIEGFSADAPAPARPPIPELGIYTRSAFEHSERPMFRRLLTFSMPQTARFYHRFSLLHNEGTRPILCMGNEQSRFYFWDLYKLEEGLDAREDGKGKGGKRRGKRPKSEIGSLRNGSIGKDDTSSNVGDGVAAESTTGTHSSTLSEGPIERVSVLGDPFAPIAPHFTTTPHTKLTMKGNQQGHFATSQLAWSPDGTWLVSVGDKGVMCIFHRDASVVNGVPNAADPEP